MAIPLEIQALIDRINQELDLAEREATEGLNQVRSLLSLFPDNAILIQFFAALTNVLFFVESYRRRVHTTVEQLSADDAPDSVIQDAGEDLATMLGVVLETKIRVERIINRLGDLL